MGPSYPRPRLLLNMRRPGRGRHSDLHLRRHLRQSQRYHLHSIPSNASLSESLIGCIAATACVRKEDLIVWKAEAPPPDGEWIASADTVQNGGFGSARVDTSVLFKEEDGRPARNGSTHLRVSYNGHPDLNLQTVKYWGVNLTAQDLSEPATPVPFERGSLDHSAWCNQRANADSSAFGRSTARERGECVQARSLRCTGIIQCASRMHSHCPIGLSLPARAMASTEF
jgi:hypothetical protein